MVFWFKYCSLFLILIDSFIWWCGLSVFFFWKYNIELLLMCIIFGSYFMGIICVVLINYFFVGCVSLYILDVYFYWFCLWINIDEFLFFLCLD